MRVGDSGCVGMERLRSQAASVFWTSSTSRKNGEKGQMG